MPIEALRRHFLPSLMLTGFVVVFLILYVAVVYGIGQVAFKHGADGSFITRDHQVVGSSLIGQSFTDAKGNPLPQYFQPRPSATSPNPYTANASAASNLGPSDPRLVGFIPGFNTVGLNGQSSKTNTFATKADPYCVPTDPKGNPVTSPSTGQKYAMSAGAYVCDPNTVPERTIAYRQLNGLAASVAVPVDAVTASASGLDPQISIANADLQAPRVARVRHLPVATVMALVKKYTTGRSLGFLGEPGVDVLELNLALDRTG
jgi:potassium-transporting ATPase KdpC subunit